MTATLWLDYAHDKYIPQGGTLKLYQAFANMADAAGPDYLQRWPDLFGVVTQVEWQEDADPEWFADMRREASDFLDAYEDQLSPEAVFILKQLSGAPYDEPSEESS
jgi:hypothetical protein